MKAYDYIKGRWPYVLAVATPVVTAAHSYGYINDSQFSILAALGGGTAAGAVAGMVKRVVTDAVMRKVSVQVRQARGEPEPASLVEEDQANLRREAELRRTRPPVTERRIPVPPPAAVAPSPYEEHDQS